MMFWLSCLIGILIIIILCLSIKIHLLKKSADEIRDAFADRIASDTNTLIDISCCDPHMMSLAAGLNEELKKLREDKLHYLQGSLELKNAITNISHDLRTPLTAMCGYLDLMKEENKAENIQRYLVQVENRADALKNLMEELFRYSIAASVEELSNEKTDIRSLLEESLVSFYGAIQHKGLVPDIHLPCRQVFRYLDPSAVTRIFNNIISNALKYSADDFNVIMDEEGTITFFNNAPDMDAVTAGQLLDRFYTVETDRNSTGLGLSIAKLLTEQMGGSIKSQYCDSMLYIILSFPDNQSF